MLKAEAVDLKSIPLLFNFPIDDDIRNIFNELKDYSVKKVKDEVLENHHKHIDKIIFDFLGLTEKQRNNVVQSLLSIVEA